MSNTAQAQDAMLTSCMAYMSAFDAKHATPDEARHYSFCVQKLYPVEEVTIEIPGKLLAGSLLLAVIVSIILGFYKRSKDRYAERTEWFDIFFIHPVMGCLYCLTAWAAYAAIVYLIS